MKIVPARLSTANQAHTITAPFAPPEMRMDPRRLLPEYSLEYLWVLTTAAILLVLVVG